MPCLALSCLHVCFYANVHGMLWLVAQIRMLPCFLVACFSCVLLHSRLTHNIGLFAHTNHSHYKIKNTKEPHTVSFEGA